MSTPRKIAIAVLLALGLLLTAAFFLVYFMGNDSQALELTAPDTGSGSSPESSAPSIPADGPVPSETASEAEARELRVYVAGAVKNPGVYPLASGNRLVDAVDAAGGVADNADLEAVNLAMRVEDEGYYYIPAKIDEPAATGDRETPDSATPTPRFPKAATNRPAAGSPDESEKAGDEDGEPAEPAEPGGLVNLNTATQAALETLPSIGPARARAIIAFREENGLFAAVEEITAVSGIGQGILDNLQGLITVEGSP